MSHISHQDPNPKRYTVPEWFKENRFHLLTAEQQCQLAERVRGESQRIRDTVLTVFERNKEETNTRLKERICEEEYRRDEIEEVRTQILRELPPLEAIERRLFAAVKSIESCNYQITQRCRHFRENRIGIDMVHDDVEKELLQELKIIESALVILKCTIEQIKETQRELRSSLYYLNKDLRDKMAVLDIDKETLSLKETNIGLSVYEGNQSLDTAVTTIEEWERFTDETLHLATKRLNTSRPLRAYVDTVLQQIEHDLRVQDRAVNEALHLRIEQVQTAKTKLENQHFEIVHQANEMSRDICEMEKAIAAKEAWLALVHTRFGKRAQRPGAELVRDGVQRSLSAELVDIRAGVAQLRQNLAQAQAVQRQLLRTQVQLEEDINVKINSLKIDEVDCMSLRQSIQHPSL